MLNVFDLFVIGMRKLYQLFGGQTKQNSVPFACLAGEKLQYTDEICEYAKAAGLRLDCSNALGATIICDSFP